MKEFKKQLKEVWEFLRYEDNVLCVSLVFHVIEILAIIFLSVALISLFK